MILRHSDQIEKSNTGPSVLLMILVRLIFSVHRLEMNNSSERVKEEPIQIRTLDLNVSFLMMP